MKIKDLSVSMKAFVEPDSEGIIEAYASVFDTIDSHKDIIRYGAFTDTLDEWERSGNTIPLLYGHDFSDPFSNIGEVLEATEDKRGLRIRARLDLNNAKAAQTFRLIKTKRLTQMSFAFDVLEGSSVELEGTQVYELRKVKLYEVSVVPIGANQETEIISVKSEAVDKPPPEREETNYHRLCQALISIEESRLL